MYRSSLVLSWCQNGKQHVWKKYQDELTSHKAAEHVWKKYQDKLTSHKDGCLCLCLVFYLSRSQVTGPLALMRSGSCSGAGGA